MSLSRADSLAEISPLKILGVADLSMLEATPPSPDTVNQLMPFTMDKLSRSPFPPDDEVQYTLAIATETSRIYSPVAFFDDNFDFESRRQAALKANGVDSPVPAPSSDISSSLMHTAKPSSSSNAQPKSQTASSRPVAPAGMTSSTTSGPSSSTVSSEALPSATLAADGEQPKKRQRSRASAMSRPVFSHNDSEEEDEDEDDDDDDDSDDESHGARKRPLKKKKKSTSTGGGSSAARSRNATSMYRGVSRCSKDGRWQARIRIRKLVVYLGRFPEEEDAARKYDEAAREHHGSRAVLNFLTPEDIRMGCKSVFAVPQSENDA